VFDFIALAHECSPDVAPYTMQRIVQVESSFNPNAVGVVGTHLERQPRDRQEAIATARWLERNGYNYSVGLAQINRTNFAKYGLTLQTAFEPCPNLHAGAQILKDCYGRAAYLRRAEQPALLDALSCYYSGDLKTGYNLGYVLRVSGDPSTAPKDPRALTPAPQKADASPATPASATPTALMF
jgi:type IV secretion system protein VirB1